MVAGAVFGMEPSDKSQNDLAESLIDCMGLESAIHVCQVNGWDGVLAILLRRSKGGLAAERYTKSRR